MTQAERYAELRPPDESAREEPSRRFTPSGELELQARWFAGEFGCRFKSTTGESIEVIQFGVWNHESGPDFAEAAISINGGPPARGCIELDPDARDWERHGHAVNPEYETVVLHVFFQRGDATFFTRNASHRNVPQVLLDASGEKGRVGIVPEAKAGRCLAPLRELSDEKVGSILDAAAQFRLRQKGLRMSQIAMAHGDEEALYQALSATLGYKGNSLPFTLLAQRLPLSLLLKDRQGIDSLLFGLSGFLKPDMAPFPDGTRSYLRDIWQGWWPRRAAWERLSLLPTQWRLSGQRPLNHPQRRIAALAQIVRNWQPLRAAMASGESRRIGAFFRDLHDDFWDFHYTLSAQASPIPLALVGESRISEMMANVFFPLAALSRPSAWEEYSKLPAVLTNRRARTAAIRLFGGINIAGRLLKTAARQQGLLQIYEDFCMRDSSDCERCLFPRQITQWA